MSSLQIVTWNVNSIAARLPLVLHWLESFAPDQRPGVICLQEIKCVDAKFPADDFTKIGYHSEIYGQPNYNGVTTLIRQDLAPTIAEVQKGFPGEADDAQRRMLAVTVAGVRVVNVYIPNGQAVGSDKYTYKLDWLDQLRRYLAENCDPSQPLALCGDYNIAPDPIDVHDPAAWEGKVLFSQPEREALQRIKDWGFEDSFRRLYPEQQVFSWWDYRMNSFKRNLGLRIDHVWVTQNLMERCQQVQIDRETRTWERPSDHAPVVATFSIGN
jgi:exodeoxyribonuclease-3